MSENHQRLIPYFSLDDVQQGIDVWTNELGFTLLGVMRDDETGEALHADLTLDGSLIMIGKADAYAPSGSHGVSFHITTDRDIEKFHDSVRSQSGAVVDMPLSEQWWGERMFTASDSLGYHWMFGQQIRDRELQLPAGTTYETAETAPEPASAD